MIRESNTLTWQETAERKKMMRRRERVRRRKRKVWRIRGLLLLLSCLLILGGMRHFRQNPIKRYAKANGISMAHVGRGFVWALAENLLEDCAQNRENLNITEI